MDSSQETMEFIVYFKIPYTEVTSVNMIKKSLTTSEFVEYVNTDVRNTLNINSKYYIEVVDISKPSGELAEPIEPRNDETLLQRYGDVNKSIAFYIRPVDRITREFIRRLNYVD